jgi:hypothetical protein
VRKQPRGIDLEQVSVGGVNASLIFFGYNYLIFAGATGMESQVGRSLWVCAVTVEKRRKNIDLPEA